MVEQASQDCLQEGKLKEKKAREYVEAFKRLPLSQAIFALSHFARSLRQQLSQRTLIVESATPLTDEQIKKIEKAVCRQFQVATTEALINPALLGGLKLRLRDYVFDYSLKMAIAQLKGAIHG